MNNLKCLNSDEYKYTGKEKTPLGRGYSAAAEKIGTLMKGADGTDWRVTLKNKVHVWSRVPTEFLDKDQPVIHEEPAAEPEPPKKIAKKAVPKKEPAKEAAKEPAKEAAKEPAKEAAKEPAKEAAKEAIIAEEIIAEKVEPKTKAKKAAPKKKDTKPALVEPEIIAEEIIVEEVKPEVKPESKAKKLSPKKKEVVKPAEEVPVEEKPKKKEVAKEAAKPVEEEKPKKTVTKKPPSDYNMFVKYQAKYEKVKIADIAVQWQQFSDEQKKEIVEAARKEFAK